MIETHGNYFLPPGMCQCVAVPSRKPLLWFGCLDLPTPWMWPDLLTSRQLSPMSWAFDCQGELLFSLCSFLSLTDIAVKTTLDHCLTVLFMKIKIFNDKIEKYILEDRGFCCLQTFEWEKKWSQPSGIRNRQWNLYLGTLSDSIPFCLVPEISELMRHPY